jgi:ParB-like chromosome segregation protein Spo0J
MTVTSESRITRRAIDSDRAAYERRIERVPICELVEADSPRLNGEDREHIERLSEIGPESCPPILVHLGTMRVIDGMHRLRAAALRGQDEVEVEFFEGSEEEAFLVAVTENTWHGLPLTLADRRAAAARIVVTHPFLSDRAIGKHTGLSHKTVAAVRSAQCLERDPAERVGVDGRSRPVNSQDGRRRALELITSRPQASLREIAVAAGISVGTAHDVRKRIEQGADPVNVRLRATSRPRVVVVSGTGRSPGRPRAEWRASTADILQSLARDPKFRYADTGRLMLRWLSSHAVGVNDWRKLIDAVPPHRVSDLSAIAQQCSKAWAEFGLELERCRQRELHPERDHDLARGSGSR